MHLSPFADGAEGYMPTERVLLQAEMDVTSSLRRDAERTDKGWGNNRGQDAGVQSAKSEDGEAERWGEQAGGQVGAAQRAHCVVEVAGEVSEAQAGSDWVTEADSKEGMSGRRPCEDKELAKLMMSRKKKRLYDQMQHGIKKKEAAFDALRQKRGLR